MAVGAGREVRPGLRWENTQTLAPCNGRRFLSKLAHTGPLRHGRQCESPPESRPIGSPAHTSSPASLPLDIGPRRHAYAQKPMRFPLQTLSLLALLSGAPGLFAAPAAPGAEPATAKPGEPAPLAVEPVDFRQFQAFVRNWTADDKPRPLFAILHSVAEWEEVFHPAPVMGRNRPFAPERARFENSHLILAAYVTAPGEGGARPLQIEAVTLKDNEVQFRYRFKPAAAGTFQVKECLGVWIPKGTYRRVVFIENGKTAGALDLTKGEWVQPVLPEEAPAGGA